MTLTSATLMLALALAQPAGAADPMVESRKSFLAARTAIADGRYQDALALYRKVLTILPNDPIVHLEYAQLLRDLNVGEEATRQAREAVRLDPNLAEARRLLGSLELGAAEKDPARLPAAIEELSAAHRLAPGDIGTSVTLARALLAADRPAEAAAILDELPELSGQPAIQRLTAEAKAKSGRYREAEDLYRALWEADPGDREVAAALIDLYEDQDKLDEALAVLEKLAARDPENQAVRERIVLDLARAGRFPESEQRARELVGKRPENRAGQRLLATVLFERGNTAEGEKILRALIEADADDPGARRALASELVRERRFDEAHAMYVDMIKSAGEDPRKADLLTSSNVELGFIAYLQRDYASARRILAPIALSGGQVQERAARILLATDRDSEDYADGRDRAKAYAGAKPSDPEWEAETAEFRYRLGETKAAEATLDALGASGQLEKMMAAADAYGRLKRYDAAVRIARAASAKFPESTDALFRLGSSLERGGDPAEAEKVFLRLLELRPNDSGTLNYLGYMWADQGVQLERAKDMLEKAVARDPRNAAYLDSLGWAYFRLGQLPVAEKNLREAYRREPADPT
ncbi:MAG TPA: tetratricopeptide repeat protein, partial [Thermoanaerobaculia bacterium]|nr:tetratricopeptide repeat protein [Thermoanaerobaculia bacterium]